MTESGINTAIAAIAAIIVGLMTLAGVIATPFLGVLAKEWGDKRAIERDSTATNHPARSIKILDIIRRFRIIGYVVTLGLTGFGFFLAGVEYVLDRLDHTAPPATIIFALITIGGGIYSMLAWNNIVFHVKMFDWMKETREDFGLLESCADKLPNPK